VFGGVGVGSGGALNLSTLNGSNGFVIRGIDAYDRSGSSVSSAGDINGDGIDDIIIGAPLADANGNFTSGESYVVFGSVGVGSGGVLDPSNLNGSNGFVVNGVDTSDGLGNAVSSAGDVNGDGISDLLIGSPFASPNGVFGAGESYVVFGSVGVGSSGVLDPSNLNGTNGFVLNGIDPRNYSGISVSNAGDVNGDGIDDIIIGASRVTPNSANAYAGASYVVFGGTGVGDGGVLNLSTLDGTNGFAITGIDPRDFSGDSVSGAGDVNGDGVDDIIIGAGGASPNDNTFAGESYVIYGGAGVGIGGVFSLLSLNGTNGFVLTGIDSFDFSGRSVSGAGDVNNDGIDDIIIGANGADPDGGESGESYVVFGQATGAPPAPIVGNSGNNTLNGTPQNDTIAGLDGNDTLNGNNGDDALLGGNGQDRLNGGRGHDFLDGGAGNDTLNGNEGNNKLFGGEGRDTLNGGSGDDLFDGGTGDDTFNGNGGTDTFFGGEGNDLINGGTGNDTVDGGEGNDIINGNGGNDRIFGGNGNDRINTGTGNDIVYGDVNPFSTPDRFRGGDDVLIDRGGDNTFFGGVGNDTIQTGSGDDLIYGGAGSDSIRLNGGNDLVVLELGDGFDTIQGFRLGSTKLGVGSTTNLSFANFSGGVNIFQNGDQIAFVQGVRANTLINNVDNVFVTSGF
jgi:hypothetical protein